MDQADWDPTKDDVLRDQHTAYDEMREEGPVAYSERLRWSVFRHEDIVRILHDTKTFSNQVSTHLSVPNGMDPPVHTDFRRMIDMYFQPDRMKAFEPVCRNIASDLLQTLHDTEVDIISDFAQPFAVRCQCAFLGWPSDMYEPLRLWVQKQQKAIRVQDRAALADIAHEFEGYVERMLHVRREAVLAPGSDVTTSLLHARVQGRRLHHDEVTSILRNWTVGEVGTLSAAVGIAFHFAADNISLQKQLRTRPSTLDLAIDEILRIHAPLVTNRRRTTRPVAIGGRIVDAGKTLSLMWGSANRDPRVFKDPETFRPGRDPAPNLLYGSGIHACPGAPLARLELRVALDVLFQSTDRVTLIPDKQGTKAIYPASGFSTLPLRLYPRSQR